MENHQFLLLLLLLLLILLSILLFLLLWLFKSSYQFIAIHFIHNFKFQVEYRNLSIFQGVPGRPTEVSTSDFKDNKVRISWTLGRDNYSPVTKVHVFYRTRYEEKKWYHMITTTNIKTRGSVDVLLSPWAAYRFKVVSENGVGNSTPSVETFPWLKSVPAGWFFLCCKLYVAIQI